MKNRLHHLIAAAALLCATQAAAQGLFKCSDATGKVTYASQPCELLGLKPAGEIRDRSNVSPAYKAPPPAAQVAPAARAPSAAGQAAKKDAAKQEEDRRCFKTAKGTRCNDTPDEKSQ